MVFKEKQTKKIFVLNYFVPAILVFILLNFSSIIAQNKNQHIFSQKKNDISKVWVPDLGNGKYKNPIIYADYSDPDVCRKGDDYYLVSSSFDAVPGLPILHSNDLVNWTIIGHALLRQPPYKHFSKPRHGNGVWAPAIRYHKNEFYIYYPDPDYGIYLVKAKDPAGPWSVPILVQSGKGLIDPCPLWDDDGKIYLVHAYAGSRAGIKSILTINRLNEEGTKFLDNGVIVYDGHGIDPTVEGPKIYKRNGYYYIFAPAGGVSNGWQLVLRSKNIYGLYERRVVMAQGKTTINGPHQGAWVETPEGKSWFIHFSEKGAYGRVVYLEPMKWADDWPVIGVDDNGNGIGEPVYSYIKPEVEKTYPIKTPQTSDEFNTRKLGLQWQWQANPGATWLYTSGEGYIRLYARTLPDSIRNYWDVPNILMQKFPADKFQVTSKLTFHPLQVGDKTGFIVMGMDYAYLSLSKKEDGIYLSYTTCKDANKGNAEETNEIKKLADGTIFFRVIVDTGAICHFSYSLDGSNFSEINKPFAAQPGQWIGAKLGMFCSSTQKAHDSGYADFDWFKVEQINN